jgi:hypothetical protein
MSLEMEENIITSSKVPSVEEMEKWFDFEASQMEKLIVCLPLLRDLWMTSSEFTKLMGIGTLRNYYKQNNPLKQ